MTHPEDIVSARASDGASGSYVLLTTSPSLGPATNHPPSPTALATAAASRSARPVAHPRFLLVLLILAALDLALVLGYGLPVAVREEGMWASEAVGLVRVGVVGWAGASRNVGGRKEAVLSMVVLSFLLLVYKLNELVQRHPLDPTWRSLLPPLLPPNPLAWYALSSALSLAHFAAFFTIVGVHHVQISRGRRQTGDRERRVGAPASPQVWRGRQDSVRAPATPSIHGHRGESDADVSDFSDELNSDDDVDPGDDEDGEDGELSGTDSSEDEHDLIDIPRPGAPSLRHRASRTSWRGPGDEESAGQEHSRGEMTRSFSRRSGLSFRGASSAEGGGYGSLSIGGI